MTARNWLVLTALLFATMPSWSQPYGMGPGMMQGYGYGMGPGMMPGYGMGPGMMGQGSWARSIPNLSSEQRKKIDEVDKDLRQKQWQLMEKMHELHYQQGNTYREGAFDEQAARKNFDAITGMHKQMFELSLEHRRRIEQILTPQQREQMQRAWSGR